MSDAPAMGRSQLRPLARDEVEGKPHWLEGQQEVGKDDRGVDVDAADWLERDFGCEIGRATDVEQRVARANRAVLRHVPSSLPHEPHRRGVDWLSAAGLQETRLGHVSQA